MSRSLSSEALPPVPVPETIQRRTKAFAVAPSVSIAEKASTRTTVVEVNTRDRTGLLAALARAIHDQTLQVHSAHIATYGERAVEVFYLTDLAGGKIEHPPRLKMLQSRLLKAAARGAAHKQAA